MEFGETVDPGGRSLPVLGAGSVVGVAPEDVVRAHVDQQGSELVRHFGEIAHGARVEQFGKLGLVFRGVHVGECRAVHYHVGLMLRRSLPDGVDVGDVEPLRGERDAVASQPAQKGELLFSGLGDIGEKEIVGRTGGHYPQPAPQLTV